MCRVRASEWNVHEIKGLGWEDSHIQHCISGLPPTCGLMVVKHKANVTYIGRSWGITIVKAQSKCDIHRSWGFQEQEAPYDCKKLPIWFASITLLYNVNL
jgi:hypothetical protein